MFKKLLSIVGIVGVLAIAGCSSSDLPTKLPSPTVAELVVPSNVSNTGTFAVDNNGGIIPISEADSNKTRVEIIFDPHCAGCRVVETGIRGSLRELNETGQVQLFFTTVSFMNHNSTGDYSSRAASALVTVAEYDPTNFSNFMDALYDNFPESGSEVTDELLAEWALDSGVSQVAVDKFSDNVYERFVLENVAVQEQRTEIFPNGTIATPVVLIGGTVNDNGDLSDSVRVLFESSDVNKAFMETYTKYLNSLS